MSNTDKQLAELEAVEKKLFVQHKKERDAVNKKLAAVKKQIREEQRTLNERRAALLGHCMMQKFSSDPETKEAMLQDLDGFLSKPEDRELFGLLQNKLLQEKNPETFPGSFHIPGSLALCVDRRGVATPHGNRGAPAWHRRGKPFFGTVDAVAGPGWHRGRQGTERTREE